MKLTKENKVILGIFVGALVLTGLIFTGLHFWIEHEKQVNAERLKQENKVENIARIFMHEPGVYSFLIADKDGILHPTDNYRYSPEHVKMPSDVPKGKLKWAREYYALDPRWPQNPTRYLEIHIHSEKDIEGGGYNHGKFGRGQTSVVE